MPKIIRKKKFKPTWYPCLLHSNETFWNTKSFIATGRERFREGNAYFIDSSGFRQYHVKFLPGIRVFIDPDRTRQPISVSDSMRTGRQLLERFYALKLKPITFKWIKAKSRLETSHWVVVYPAHYLVMVEKSEKGMHANDHEATLYYRGNLGSIQIAQQHYEGHLKGNFEYKQPDILREELRDWRMNRGWFQDAMTREQLFEV